MFIDGCFTKGVELFKIFIDLIEKYVTNTLANAEVSKVKAGKLQPFINPNEPLSKPSRQLLVQVNNRNTRTRCEICSKLTIKTPERRLVSLLLTLNIFHTLF